MVWPGSALLSPSGSANESVFVAESDGAASAAGALAVAAVCADDPPARPSVGARRESAALMGNTGMSTSAVESANESSAEKG
jgi:hypothetical protein